MYSKTNLPTCSEISIFRIEHKVHLNGVFSASEILHSAIGPQLKKFPGPFSDGCCVGGEIPEYMVFGTTDIHILMEWICLFEEQWNNFFVISNLISNNYIIREFKVKAIDCIFSHSGRQILFNPTEARELKKYQDIQLLDYVEEFSLPTGDCSIEELPREWVCDGQLFVF